jgi:dihydroorotase
MVALETTLGLIVTKLIEPGHLDWMTALAKLTVNPARVLGIDKGTLRIGADADVVIIDPQASWTVDPSQFRSKSINTPLRGWTLRGRVVQTLVGGQCKL